MVARILEGLLGFSFFVVMKLSVEVLMVFFLIIAQGRCINMRVGRQIEIIPPSSINFSSQLFCFLLVCVPVDVCGLSSTEECFCCHIFKCSCDLTRKEYLDCPSRDFWFVVLILFIPIFAWGWGGAIDYCCRFYLLWRCRVLG